MSTDIAKIDGTEIQYLAMTETKKERKTVVVDRELEKIYTKHSKVDVDVVLKEAAKPTSPLHSYFEWDDAVAGDKYRKVQAYSLIMGSMFVVQLVQDGKVSTPEVITETGQVRRLVSAFRGEGFRLRNEALADDDMRKAIVETKKSVLRSWCKSTIDIPELQPLRKTILAKLR